MSKETVSQFSFGSFVWWVGVIEDVNDPEKSGRVKVRIFGYHSNDKNDVPTSSLPWSTVALPTTSASHNGIGNSPHALEKDSHVIGFFSDGANAQLPIVMFSFHGIKDIDPLATGQKVKNSITNSGQWSEKPSNAKPVYPHNKVYKTSSGHVIEYDDTPSNERINIYHRTGSFIEIHNDGTVVKKSVKDSYEVTLGNQFIFVSGNLNLVVNGNVTETIKGNKTTNVSGNYSVSCNSYSIKTNSSWNVKCGSSGYLKCGGVLQQKASVILLN